MVQTVQCRSARSHTMLVSHDFYFRHKPIVYGVAYLILYGVMLLDNVNYEGAVSCGPLKPRNDCIRIYATLTHRA